MMDICFNMFRKKVLISIGIEPTAKTSEAAERKRNKNYLYIFLKILPKNLKKQNENLEKITKFNNCK